MLFLELCERLGICLSIDQQLRLTAAETNDVDRFTQGVLVAEGFDPPELCDKSLRRKVRAIVANHLSKLEPS
jgi:hypothetical protein